jgi:gluconolactonase
MTDEPRSISTLSALALGLDHPEGVAWGPDGKAYAGGEAGQLYRISLEDGTFETFGNTGGNVLGIALDAAANAYACDLERREVVRVSPEGEVTSYCAGSGKERIRLPNYPLFDDAGNLYVSDSGDWGARDGCIWRVRPGGDAEVWDRQACGFTNGMCLSADGLWLYVVESSPPLIARIRIARDGSAERREVLIELPRTVPDGIALDVDGNLYISFYNPNLIYRLRYGELTTLYDDWEQLKLLAPTNIAFGGVDMKTLLIANLAGTHLATAPMEVAGLPVRYPGIA